MPHRGVPVCLIGECLWASGGVNGLNMNVVKGKRCCSHTRHLVGIFRVNLMFSINIISYLLFNYQL